MITAYSFIPTFHKDIHVFSPQKSPITRLIIIVIIIIIAVGVPLPLRHGSLCFCVSVEAVYVVVP